MRKSKIYLLAISIALIGINSSFGQATSSDPALPSPAPNTPNNPGVDYLGWAFGVSLDLNIKNEDAMPIRFYTNAGADNLTPKSPIGDFKNLI